MKPFVIDPSPHRVGFYRCLYHGSPPQLESTLRASVGAVKVSGIWVVPMDIIGRVVEAAKACGYEIRGDAEYVKDYEEKSAAYLQGLHPYQRAGVVRVSGQRRLMLNFKPGLGKTATALRSMQAAGVSRALIVCPAIVRDTWVQQFAIWWSKAAHEVQVVETGKEAAAATAPFVVISYELLAKVAPQAWDAVVFDECHYLKEPSSKRSKEALKVLDPKTLSKESLRLFLTGTPIANEPIDVHNQVELLYPGLWGNRFEFQRRYCASREAPHARSGLAWYGVNPRYADELRERLAHVSVSATEEEIAGLLPPVTFEAVRVKPTRAFNVREYLDEFARSHGKDKSAAIRACGMVKVEHTVELVRNDLAGGATHVSVMTHLRDTAREVAAALAGEGVPVACITGDDDHKRRHEEIARLAKEPKAVFVGTMHCVNVGINELKDFPHVVYTELDYRPDEVVQSMKRYHRIGGQRNVRIRVLVLEGTLEERVAKSVGRKLRDQKMITDVGTLADNLEHSLDARMDDDEFFERVQAAAAKMQERDLYA